MFKFFKNRSKEQRSTIEDKVHEQLDKEEEKHHKNEVHEIEVQGGGLEGYRVKSDDERKKKEFEQKRQEYKRQQEIKAEQWRKKEGATITEEELRRKYGFVKKPQGNEMLQQEYNQKQEQVHNQEIIAPNQNVQVHNPEEQLENHETEQRKKEEFEKKRQEYKRQQAQKAELWRNQEEERKMQEQQRMLEEYEKKVQRIASGGTVEQYIGESQYYDEDKKELRDANLSIANTTLRFTFEDNSAEHIELPDSCYYYVKVEQTNYWIHCNLYNELGDLVCIFKTDYKLLREKDQNRISIEQSALVENHFELLNRVVTEKRLAFEKRANDLINHLLENREVTNLLINYLAKTDQNYYLDSDYLVAFEKTLFSKDRTGKGILACDPISNDWPESVDREQVNRYYTENYSMLMKVLDNKNLFETTQDAIFVPWLMLRNLAVPYFHDVFEEQYGNHFMTLNEHNNIKDYVSIYAMIDTINIELVTNASYLTYFYLKRRNDSFEKYLDYYQEIKSEILVVIKNKELSNFEASLLGTSNKSQISITDVDMMDGHEFERFIENLFRKMGYSAEVTKGSGDQGIDVIAIKDGRKFGIQTKCYGSTVNNKAIQEAAAGIKHYKLDKGLVVTNNYFTNSAIELAASNGIILWDRTILKEKIEEFL